MQGKQVCLRSDKLLRSTRYEKSQRTGSNTSVFTGLHHLQNWEVGGNSERLRYFDKHVKTSAYFYKSSLKYMPLAEFRKCTTFNLLVKKLFRLQEFVKKQGRNNEIVSMVGSVSKNLL